MAEDPRLPHRGIDPKGENGKGAFLSTEVGEDGRRSISVRESMPMSSLEDRTDDELLIHLRDEPRVLAILFARHRPRLWRMAQLRLDRRLLGRLDPDDVLQEAYLDASRRIQHFQREDSSSFFLWLRLIVGQTLVDLHRRHLGALARDAGREVSIDHAGPHAPEVDSASMALELMGQLTPASHVFQRREMSQRMQEALEGLSATDREVLVLRHFEELTNSEVSQVLNIQAKAASIRYVRALARLKAVLERDPEFHEES